MKRRALLLAALALAAAAPAAGEEPEPLPQEIRLEDVFRLLREKSPRAQNEESVADFAAADLVSASLLPNPNLSYGNLSKLSGANTIDGTQHTVTLGLPLLLLGQRSARRDAAEKALDSAHDVVRSRYVELAQRARELFIEVLADREIERSLAESQAELERASEIARNRASAGLARQYDVVKVEIEKNANDTRLADARADSEAAAGELATWLGFPGWHPTAVGELRPLELRPDLDALWQQAEASPALAAAREAEAAAKASQSAARLDRWPVPVVTLGTNITTNQASTNALAGVSVDLPVFDRGQGKLAHAEAQELAAARQRNLIESATRAELERDVRLLASRRAALASFEQNVAGELPRLRQMAEDAYKSGQGGVIDLIDAIRSRSDLRLEHIELVHDLMNAEVDALAASGRIDALAP